MRAGADSATSSSRDTSVYVPPTHEDYSQAVYVPLSQSEYVPSTHQEYSRAVYAFKRAFEVFDHNYGNPSFPSNQPLPSNHPLPVLTNSIRSREIVLGYLRAKSDLLDKKLDCIVEWDAIPTVIRRQPNPYNDHKEYLKHLKKFNRINKLWNVIIRPYVGRYPNVLDEL